MNCAAEFLPVARGRLAFLRARRQRARRNGAACVTRTRDPRITNYKLTTCQDLV
jgi:hypothetical protein